MLKRTLLRSTMALMLAAPSAWAGPDWNEDGDAGSTPSLAQRLYGEGPLHSISGALALAGIAGDDDDLQDMYLVRIEQPTVITFSASTEPNLDGSASFDTRLWLFDAAGIGLLANDDAARDVPESTLLDASTDGTGVVITEPGLYFIAVSGAGTEPLSDDDDRGSIFIFAAPTEISGPDGLGGDDPIDEWSIDGDQGTYVIAFTGVAFITPGDLNGDGAVNGVDLAMLLGSWGPCASGSAGCLADLDGDGVVGGFDLAILLGNWD